MSTRLWALAVSVAFVASGCVIHTGEGRRAPPPPAPPHRAGHHHPGSAPPAMQPRIPAQSPPAQSPPAQPPLAQPPPVSQLGTLAILVTDGTCDIAVDGAAKGNINQLSVDVAAGAHTVTCSPVGGAMQTQKPNVGANAITAVSFSVKQPQNTKTSLPVNKAPPVGRPTPGAQ